ncbi:T-kininogen 1-like isoform X4 [Lissotriton helveticus]
MKWLALLLLCFQVFSSEADHHQATNDASCNDPKVFEAMDLALKKYNADRKEGNQFALRRITEAGTTGEHYHVTYEIIESTCPAHDGHVWQDCQLKPRAEAAIGVCHAEVGINSAGKTGNVISQECNITPKMCVGCPFPIWSDDANLQPVARHAIQKFNQETNDRHYYKLESISKATRQVVAGTRYVIKYTYSETDCPKSKFKEVHPGCKPVKYGGRCTATVYVALNGSIASSQLGCVPAPPVIPCLGCPTHISSNSEELKPILKLIIGNFNEGSKPNLFRMEEVLSATSQVVAGKRYEVEYLYRETDCPKSEFKEVHSDCKPLETHGRCKSSVHVALNGSIASIGHGCVPAPPAPGCRGCHRPISSDSEQLKPILEHCIRKFNNESGQMNLFKLGEIQKATSQVVAGTNYNIEYTIKETTCSKKESKELHGHCSPTKVSGSCKSTVYVDLKHSIANIQQNCTIHAPPLPCLGCPKPLETNSSRLVEPLAHSVKKYNSESNNAVLYKVDHILEATSQVVSGTKYAVTFTIRPTNCSKASNADLHAGCHFDVGHEFKRCQAEIVVVPWLKKVDPLKVDCSETILEVAAFAIPGLSPFRSVGPVKLEDGHVTHHGQGYVPEAPTAMCPGETWKPKSPNPLYH